MCTYISISPQAFSIHKPSVCSVPDTVGTQQTVMKSPCPHGAIFLVAGGRQ